MSRFNSIDDVWAFLEAIPMFQQKGAAAANFSLDNIRAFCAKLGDPQHKYPTIHVAGTNGKGTTCYLLEQIYAEAGYKTGLFTSPHLLRYNERVRVNQKEISDEALLKFFQLSDPLLDEIYLSYFEVSTALAFWYFAEAGVDLAIIETGLGGRLDSTNIIIPEVSLITSIGLDHQDVLGNSVEQIAREKAGIIKSGKPVVVGNVAGLALDEVEKIAKEKHSKLLFASDLSPVWNHGRVELDSGSINIPTNFYEKVNKWNIAVCWLVGRELHAQFPLEKNRIEQAITAFKGVPGRFEKLHPEFEWYFSGSHNREALESSLQAAGEMKVREETILVFSALKDKWNTDTADYFSGFKKTWFVQQEGERAAKFTEIRKFVDAQKMDESNAEIILKELQTELVIFMGSFYFYPTVKRWTINFQH